MTATIARTAPRTPQTAPGPLDKATGRGPDQRDAFFDNAKFLLITLVVIGHTLTTLTSKSDGARAAYYWIYSFHMPAFIIVAGYFAQHATFDDKRARRLVMTTLVPFAIFTVLYAALRWGYGDDFAVDFITPFWLLWFLPALFIWRLVGPIVERLRWPVLTTLGVALAAGTFTTLDRSLSLNRAIALLPFFALGLVLNRRVFTVLGKLPMRALAVMFLTGAAVAAVITVRKASPSGWLTWDEGYDALHVSVAGGVVGRTIMFLIAVAMTAAFLSLVPQRRTWFTRLGQASLTCYLLHGFVVQAFRHSSLGARVGSPVSYVVVVAAAIALATVLSSPWVRTAARPLVEPQGSWLFRTR